MFQFKHHFLFISLGISRRRSAKSALRVRKTESECERYTSILCIECIVFSPIFYWFDLLFTADFMYYSHIKLHDSGGLYFISLSLSLDSSNAFEKTERFFFFCYSEIVKWNVSGEFTSNFKRIHQLNCDVVDTMFVRDTLLYERAATNTQHSKERLKIQIRCFEILFIFLSCSSDKHKNWYFNLLRRPFVVSLW